MLVSTPSYALTIAQALGRAANPMELGLFGGEPWTERMRTQLERALGLTAVNFYGLSEMCGPGVAAECLEQRDGLHVQEDHFLVEVSTRGRRRLEPGREGELVFTTLTKEAMPLIRYRTRDIGRLTGAVPVRPDDGSPRRPARAHRRHADRRGVNLHPSHVEHLLLGVDGVAPHYRLVLERPGTVDELTLECEPAASSRPRGPARAHRAAAARAHRAADQRSAYEPGSIPAARARRSEWWIGASSGRRASFGGAGLGAAVLHWPAAWRGGRAESLSLQFCSPWAARGR